ncbi:MAG: periplasmic heavy metal sensor [Myxococcales bacterium]|nr:periplasmic heavy metal sensor [Myxococcales bacterium]
MRRLSTSPLRIAGVLALVASLSGSAFAQRPNVSPGFPPGLAEARLIREMPEEIGVGEETLKKLEKLVAEVKAKEKELKAKLVEARNAVEALLDQNRPDEKKLTEAVGAASAVMRQTRELYVKSSIRIRALLTDEQLEKFMEIRKKAMKRRQIRGKGGRPKRR